MPKMTEPTQLEVDIANALGLNLATTVRGSLLIDFDTRTGMQARWDGAMTLTGEQATAVRRIVEEGDARRRAASGTDRARRALADLTPEQRRQLLADLDENRPRATFTNHTDDEPCILDHADQEPPR